MPIINLFDRVKQKSTTAGSGNITFTSSVAAFVDFSGVYTDGDELYYAIENLTDFEVGIGTYSGNALSRDTVLKSSNSDNLLNLPGDANTFVYNTYAASGAVYTSGDRLVTNVDGIDFNPIANGSQPSHQEGRIFYDLDNHALAVYNDEAEITLQVGQEEYLRVRNNTTGVISNGEAVRILGSQGTHVTIEKAIATGDFAAQAIGLATHDIEQNSFGYVTTYGVVNDVNTNDFEDGDEVFLSPEVSGGLTGVAPTAPNYKLSLGHVVRKHPTVGQIVVKPSTPKLGGGDVKSLGNKVASGVAFTEQIAGTDAAIIASYSGLLYDSGNAILQVDAGGVRFPDGATQTIAYTGQTGGGGSTPTGIESGVAFFSTTNNELTGVSNFVYNQVLNQLGINADPQAGLHVKNDTSAYPVLTVEAGAGQALPLTRWINENGVVVATVDYESGTFANSGGFTFPDGVTQTIAYTGQGGGGGTYTAGSGLVLDGDEFNIYGGTGDFDEIQFSSTPRILGLTDPITIPAFVAGYAVTGHREGVVIGSNINAANLGDQMVTIGSNLLADCSPDMQKSVVIGDEAVSNLSALGIVAIGFRAGRSLDPDFGTNADRAVFIGYQCGNNISGDGADDFDNVVGIGGFAFSDATNVKEAVGIGYFAGHDSVGEDTTFIGYFAGHEQQGDFNFSVGSNAGRSCVGSYNLSLGFNANRSTVGSNNLEFVTQGSIPSVIGTNSNKLHIENTIIGDTSSKLLAIGNVGSANLTPDATLEILPNASTDIPLIVHGAASQTANLQEWQDSAANILLEVDADGNISGAVTGTFLGGVGYGDGLVQKNAWPADVVENGTTVITLTCNSHANKYLRTTSASPTVIQIPSGLGCELNSVFSFEQAGAGSVNFSGAPGVTLNSFNSATGIEGQYAVAHLKQVATDTYTLYGDIA